MSPARAGWGVKGGGEVTSEGGCGIVGGSRALLVPSGVSGQSPAPQDRVCPGPGPRMLEVLLLG